MLIPSVAGVVENTECGLLFSGQWDSMEEYMCYIPRTTYEGTFYRAVFALHMENYQQAQQVGLMRLICSSPPPPLLSFCHLLSS